MEVYMVVITQHMVITHLQVNGMISMIAQYLLLLSKMLSPQVLTYYSIGNGKIQQLARNDDIKTE